MPSFRITAQHLVTYEYEVEAATLKAAIEKVENEPTLEPISPETVVGDTFEVNVQLCEEAKRNKPAA